MGNSAYLTHAFLEEHGAHPLLDLLEFLVVEFLLALLPELIEFSAVAFLLQLHADVALDPHHQELVVLELPLSIVLHLLVLLQVRALIMRCFRPFCLDDLHPLEEQHPLLSLFLLAYRIRHNIHLPNMLDTPQIHLRRLL